MSMLNYRDLLKSNIHVIDDFATSEELAKILDNCYSFLNWDNTWHEHIDGQRYTERPDCQERSDVSSRALSLVSATVGKRLCFLYEPYLRKYEPGSYLKMHADAEGYYGINNKSGNILFFPASLDLYDPEDYGDLVAFLTFKHLWLRT